MQFQTLEPSDDIGYFIAEGTHRLATISMNDYGFLLSARMAQTYLGRAGQVLESRQGFDREFFNEVSALKNTVASIDSEYAKFENFCIDCERFERIKTASWRTRFAFFIPGYVRF